MVTASIIGGTILLEALIAWIGIKWGIVPFKKRRARSYKDRVKHLN